MLELDLPIRRADLDVLDHVNNVNFLDFAGQARAIMRAAGDVPADSRIASVAAEYRRPLPFDPAGVRVRSELDGSVLRQSIALVGDDAPNAVITTTYGRCPSAPAVRTDAELLAAVVRHGDLDIDGSVSPTKFFEIFQEARIELLVRHGGSPRWLVVAMVAAQWYAPLPWKAEPYETRVWVGRVGTSSATVRAQFVEQGRVLACGDAVFVCFDPATQRSRPLDDAERTAFDAARRD